MKPSGNRHPAAEFLPAALLLAFAVWAAHFWHFRQFGIYEDDWGFVAVPMFWNWQDALRTFWLYLTTWPQGRPVSFVASGFLAFAGTHLGGLPGAYFAGFLLNAGTTVLFYAALCRCFRAPVAFCGALAVTLFPAYSAATLLTNTFMPGVSLFFMVLTIWFYLRNRRLATYLASAFTILSYESCFLPLFALPLLEATSWPRLRREMLRHCSILAAIAAVAFSVRGSIGEPKVATFTSHFSDSLSRVVQAIYLGPRTALYSWLQTPLRLWNERTPEVELFVLIMIPILALALWYLATRP
ncbi:MAG TPA: hypothetical protein VG672_19970, partial [Bryobacteraceae bacterium]|nr:hypothetical protein [Bryobacteraceae bacterium]